MKKYILPGILVSIALVVVVGFYFLSYVLGYQNGLSLLNWTDNPSFVQLDVPRQNTVWELVNNYRVEQKLPKFEEARFLCDMSLARLFELQDDYSHDGFVERFADKDYRKYLAIGLEIGENLNRGWGSAQDFFDSWLASAPHKELLDDPDAPQGCVRCTSKICSLLVSRHQ